ncbi:uncharacterized protein METZ01_LOCUS266241, partial [marine metagenome]
WPTPTTQDNPQVQGIGSRGTTLGGAVRMKEDTSGPMNPTFLEWLMGYPIGWTELGS